MLDRGRRKNGDMVVRGNSYPSLFPRDWISDFFSDNWMPFGFEGVRVDVRETDSDYIIEAELPGMTKDDIEISLDHDMLTIRAHQESASEEKDDKGRYIRRERHSGSFQRSFVMDNVKTDSIAADMKNGVLTITCPKEEAKVSTSRKIDIQ